MTNIELAKQMECNFISQFRLLSGINGAILAENEFATEFVSGYSTDWMNGVLQANGNVDNLEGTIGATLEKYSQSTPMLWRIGSLSENPERIRKALVKAGLKCTGHDPGMVLNPNKFSKAEPIDSFEVQSINDSSKLADYLVPFADAYELQSNVVEHFRQFISPRLGNSTYEGWFIGFWEDAPVSSAYYLTDNDVTMLYGVATVGASRKRGFARLVIDAAIEHALSRSSFPIALYASDMGESLYHKMGFEQICTLSGYLYPSEEMH